MIRPTSLDSLLSQIQEMTLVERKSHLEVSSRRVRWFEKTLLCGYFLSLIFMSAVAAWYQISPAQLLIDGAWAFYAIAMAFAVLYLMTCIWKMGSTLWRERKQRYLWLLAPMQIGFQQDADYLSRLSTFDKPLLEYALLQYRHRLDILDSRVGLLAGELRKIGVFPAFAASAIAASTLVKNGSNVYLWVPLILASSFYLIALQTIGQRERPQQVIGLLELAIKHVKSTVPVRTLPPEP